MTDTSTPQPHSVRELLNRLFEGDPHELAEEWAAKYYEVLEENRRLKAQLHPETQDEAKAKALADFNHCVTLVHTMDDATVQTIRDALQPVRRRR